MTDLTKLTKPQLIKIIEEEKKTSKILEENLNKGNDQYIELHKIYLSFRREIIIKNCKFNDLLEAIEDRDLKIKQLEEITYRAKTCLQSSLGFMKDSLQLDYYWFAWLALSSLSLGMFIALLFLD